MRPCVVQYLSIPITGTFWDHSNSPLHYTDMRSNSSYTEFRGRIDPFVVHVSMRNDAVTVELPINGHLGTIQVLPYTDVLCLRSNYSLVLKWVKNSSVLGCPCSGFH